MLDTDERITPELRQAIQAVLAAPTPGTVYSIARRNYFLGRFMRHSGWYPDRVTRLYERERYQYNDNLVHESGLRQCASRPSDGRSLTPDLPGFRQLPA